MQHERGWECIPAYQLLSSFEEAFRQQPDVAEAQIRDKSMHRDLWAVTMQACPCDEQCCFLYVFHTVCIPLQV
jgi:hypothetical protein